MVAASLSFSLHLDRIPFNVVNFNLYGSFNCTFFLNVAICPFAILHYFTFRTGLNTVFPVTVVHLSEQCLLIWFHLCAIWSDFRWKFQFEKTSFESLTQLNLKWNSDFNSIEINLIWNQLNSIELTARINSEIPVGTFFRQKLWTASLIAPFQPDYEQKKCYPCVSSDHDFWAF